MASACMACGNIANLGKPFDVIVYPGAKHGLTRQHDGRHTYATIKRFFDENLQPAERD
jgi:dipeptidyl-peptidase 4